MPQRLSAGGRGERRVQAAAGELDASPWGKSRGLEEPYDLVRHLLDTAAMAETLWDVYLTDGQRRTIAGGLGLGRQWEQARAVVAFWAALHDIGKLSVGFQASDRAGWERLSAVLAMDRGAAGAERVGHAQAGMECLPVVLQELGYEDSGRSCALWRAAEVVGGHHGRFQALEQDRVLNPHFRALLGGAAWDDQRSRYAKTVHALLGAPPAPSECSVVCAVLVTGLVILADWLVSQESYLREGQAKRVVSLEEHLGQARVAAPGLVDEAGLAPVTLVRKEFAEVHGFARPNPLQRSLIEQLPGAVAEYGPGIVLVTAATGDGKTETALEAERIVSEVSGSRGIGFLLPTMATSDRMYLRVSGFVARQLVRRAAEGASVTLTHSMAWLSSAYGAADTDDGPQVLLCEDQSEGAEGVKRAGLMPKRWLRGGKRPLLAQFAVGTVDQALMAVLPVRHNALRMLGLSGKTVIIDEAHAYDPYMQVLLGRLLHWLGAYGCSVVLLSATLPVSVSDRLIKEYLKGAGHSRRALRGQSFRAPYPGWLFVPAAGGESGPVQVRMSQEMQLKQAQERNGELNVVQYAVRHASELGGEPGGSRMALLKQELEPVLGPEGGCAVVVCTTVDDAQQTYKELRAHMTRRGLSRSELTLLHARLPGEDREKRAQAIAEQLGRSGDRPHRRIVVATQVVEQSLDLDADVVISDLAPLAQLLQRAGRCWRHEKWWVEHGRPSGRERPAWAKARGACLIVLDPLGEGGRVPPHWGEVYPEFLLRETSGLLTQRGGKAIRVPEDVQDLVEQVHGDRADRFDWEDPEQSSVWSAYQGKNLALETVGRTVVIPGVRQVVGLDELHRLEQDEWEATTRLGADSLRVLCVYRQPGGRLTLDEGGDSLLPGSEPGERLAAAEVRRIMRRTIPVRSTWIGKRETGQNVPDAWSEHPLLADLILLIHEVDADGVRGARLERGEFLLDPDLGLTRT
ncbi:CRISPR-associated endonuclease Cas3'' [Streptomyces sparsogenes]|uniref:CRISPR-associated endonuclease Cas3'' n=1 Tax=Streptomyces sparsogenes TaxID=67365 RepID=UPI00331B6EC7